MQAIAATLSQKAGN
uniref:Uncharacterized protein n=1 Tax=Anguilla anguilla TaxID=7936 RepID=A0A0E9VNZ7_ANGAN